MWKEESILKKEMAKQQETIVNCRGELLTDAEYEPLVSKAYNFLCFPFLNAKGTETFNIDIFQQILCFNLRWKIVFVLLAIWTCCLDFFPTSSSPEDKSLSLPPSTASLCYDYSGNGASTGKPSGFNTYYDIEAVYNCLKNHCGIKQEDLKKQSFHVMELGMCFFLLKKEHRKYWMV